MPLREAAVVATACLRRPSAFQWSVSRRCSMPPLRCHLLSVLFALWIGFGACHELGLVAGLSASASASEWTCLPSARDRFQRATTEEVPDFQRHISPLLGRLGCNGRACHGSFQGQGNLRLSLFGYDFAMDHRALTGKSSTPGAVRLRPDQPDESLVLKKPLAEVDHEGGKRFDKDSWQHHLLRRWIETRAIGTASAQVLNRLIVEPAEVVFGQNTAPVALRVIARWENGDQEDVTPLCRYRTNNDAVVNVDADGIVTPVGPGDSHVVVFYDNGIAAVPVLRPYVPAAVAKIDASAPMASVVSGNAAMEIDRLVQRKLGKLGIEPSALCGDTEFLRRASIDLTGSLPTPSEVERFLADSAPDKRSRKIDELLERPAYAAWWANKLCDFTGCNPAQQAEIGQEISVQWYMWIFARLRENVPYDELVRRIVLSTSREPGQSYDDFAAEMSAYFREDNPGDFGQRPTMPHYWTRRGMQKPEDAAQAFAHSFLGIKLQCAQCHKHPFAAWTQDDFKSFSQFFNTVKFGVAPESRNRYKQIAGQVGLNPGGDNGTSINNEVFKQAQRGRIIPWRELYVEARGETRSLDLLRSGPVTIPSGQDPRRPIMEWMRSSRNPWFATVFVNRVWAAYFHAGIIEPPDDLNPANPPSNPALLEWLVAEFKNRGMDMKWLHRTIANSHTYQRSWLPNATNRDDRRNFSRAIPRRMPAEVVYDSVKQALAASDKGDEVRADLSRRAIGHLSMRLAGTYAMQVFGKPDRAVNCDCERVNQPSLLQAIFLQNDPLMDDRLAESGWLLELRAFQEANRLPAAEQLVQEAWLRTLNRRPTAVESARGARHIADAESPVEGVRDLMWALLNTKEFILIQ
jgi:hypothetical protein